MSHHTIFKCQKCTFFPLSFQADKYSLNQLNTFKCPICQQLTLFDKSKFMLLESEYHLAQRNQRSALVQNSNSNEQGGLLLQCEENLQVDNEVNIRTITIFVEINRQLYDGLYLNPINPQLRNNFNIDKQQLLRQRQHVLFCFNDQVIRQRALITTREISKSQGNIKLGTRRVLKIQHLWYCVDLFIQKLAQTILLQQQPVVKQNDIEIILKSFQRTNALFQSDKNQQKKEINIKIVNSMKFSYETYRRYNSLSDQIQTINKIPTHQDVRRFQSQVIQFLQDFYYIKTQEDFQKTYRQKTNQQNIKNCAECDNIALFSHSFSEKLNTKFINKLIEQKQKQNSCKQLKNNLTINNFYFQNQYQRNDIWNQFYSEQKQIQVLKVSQYSIFHSGLYVPHSKGKFNSEDIIEKVIKSSRQKNESRENHTSVSGCKNKYVLAKQRMKSDKDLSKNCQISTNSTEKSQQSHYCQAFYRMCKKESKKIKIQTTIFQSSYKINKIQYLNIFEQTLQLLQQKNLLGFQKLILQTIKPQKKRIISQSKFIKFIQDKQDYILIDRIFCSFGERSFYYVFDYEQKMRENYEELDFLGECSLPEDLRGYAKTYEKSSIVKRNPFKKTSNPVYLVKQFQQQQQNVEKIIIDEYSDQSDDIQTL